MKFESLNKISPPVSFREALFQSIADDGGLYVPEQIPSLDADFIQHLDNFSLIDIATIILQPFIDDIPKAVLEKIVQKTFNFPLPLTKLTDAIFLLELFHGPTLAFKDVGARFMAETLAYFLHQEKKHITILVATSGDTGSAVAQGFHNIPNIDVYILYPQNKVSHLQEQQMTTLGGNIYPIEVVGTFDDCQALVKKSLADSRLKARCNLTTANSINVGRLLPQIIYYFLGIAQLRIHEELTVVVPSGNFGNLTAAAYAKAMGAPIKQLVAATNQNAVVPEYLHTGQWQPHAAKASLSNAMDVGYPNNFVRLKALYKNDFKLLKMNVEGVTVSDEETQAEIKKTYVETKVILDPHTAVGVCAARRYVNQQNPIMVAATAHPAKFIEVIQQTLEIDMAIPKALAAVMSRTKQSTVMGPDYAEWKSFLETRSSC